MKRSSYRGRFAPSPTGPLHMGSLVAAVGSYLDARHHNGSWLIRMEDLDTPRCLPGAADEILRTLTAFGLHSDEDVVYQSQRTAAYEAIFQQLRSANHLYPCGCTRREIADSALHGIEGPVYPGTCRNGIAQGRQARAWRIKTTDETIFFQDALQGTISQNLEREIGDFVVKRADGLFAYQLAVVVDDAAQRISHIVRGSDLINSTPRQIYLQQLLGLHTPAYMHLPVIVNEQGEKLSKQTLATPVDACPESLYKVLELLNQHPPSQLRASTMQQMLAWAVEHWQPETLTGLRQIPDQAVASCRTTSAI